MLNRLERIQHDFLSQVFRIVVIPAESERKKVEPSLVVGREETKRLHLATLRSVPELQVIRPGEVPPPFLPAEHEPGMGIRFVYNSQAERDLLERSVEKMIHRRMEQHFGLADICAILGITMVTDFERANGVD